MLAAVPSLMYKFAVELLKTERPLRLAFRALRATLVMLEAVPVVVDVVEVGEAEPPALLEEVARV
jgi:hypothetical protein